MPTITRTQVNKAIQKAGMQEIELVKGKGYFYFIGDNVDLSKPSVYVYKVNDLTMDQWIQEAKERYFPE